MNKEEIIGKIKEKKFLPYYTRDFEVVRLDDIISAFTDNTKFYKFNCSKCNTVCYSLTNDTLCILCSGSG